MWIGIWLIPGFARVVFLLVGIVVFIGIVLPGMAADRSRMAREVWASMQQMGAAIRQNADNSTRTWGLANRTQDSGAWRINRPISQQAAVLQRPS